jgi:hypothetical protein
MTAFRRHRGGGGRKPVFSGDFPPGDGDITETIRAVQPEWDGATFGLPAPVAERYPGTQPLDRLRAQPRYQPQQPPPAGYSATTGPMPALSRPAVSIGDALAHDDEWGPKLAPRPCGHCGTPPEIPAGILDRTRIIGHVNWLAGQAGWKYDVDIILTCPPCQQDDRWKARQGQLEVQGPDSGWYCYRHDANDPDADCACPGAVLTVDVMLASEDHLGSGRGRNAAVTR